MDENILAILLDLRVALGELQVCLSNIDGAIRKLMTVEVEVLESKSKSQDKKGAAGVNPTTP